MILQSGRDVYGLTNDKTEFTILSLQYDKYPSNPTPESLNTGIEWFREFLARNSLPHTFVIPETGGTQEVIYLNLSNGKTVAVYTICNAITNDTEENLEKQLLKDLMSS